MHPSDIRVAWRDEHFLEVRNASAETLLRVRVVVDGARVRGRRDWHEDLAELRPGQAVTVNRLELRGPAMVRVRWRLSLAHDAPWLWVEVPVPERPARLPEDPWSLGARTRK